MHPGPEHQRPVIVGASHLVSVSPGVSLQTVFNAAQPGDIIELAGGNYPAPNYPGIEKSGTASSDKPTR